MNDETNSERLYYTWDKTWDCERYSLSMEDAVERCVDEYDDESEVPERITIYALRPVRDTTGGTLVGPFSDAIEEEWNSIHDGLTDEQISRCRELGSRLAKEAYRDLNIHKLELTGDEWVVDARQWLADHHVAEAGMESTTQRSPETLPWDANVMVQVEPDAWADRIAVYVDECGIIYCEDGGMLTRKVLAWGWR